MMKNVFWILDFGFWITPKNPSSSIQNRQSKIKNNRGQSTLEYILVLSAIVAAVVVAANEVINPAVQKVITDAKTTVNSATGQLNPTP